MYHTHQKLRHCLFRDISSHCLVVSFTSSSPQPQYKHNWLLLKIGSASLKFITQYGASPTDFVLDLRMLERRSGMCFSHRPNSLKPILFCKINIKLQQSAKNMPCLKPIYHSKCKMYHTYIWS